MMARISRAARRYIRRRTRDCSSTGETLPPLRDRQVEAKGRGYRGRTEGEQHNSPDNFCQLRHPGAMISVGAN